MIAIGLVRIAAVLLIFSLCGLEAEECPPASEILPCTCRFQEAFIVKCLVGNGSIASIGHTITKQFSGKALGLLLLTNITKSSLKTESFEEISIDTLNIEDSPMIKDVEEHFFEPMAKEVKNFEFSDSSITRIPSEAISKLKILKDLAFYSSKINQILKEDIERLPKSIHRLVLINSPLSYIEEGAFTSVVNIKELSLARNHLKSLPSGNFLKGQGFYFNLDYNQFSQMTFDRFSMLSQSIVSVEDNKFRVFPSESSALKKFFESGNQLHLLGNDMDCTCDMKWVATFEPFLQRRRVLKAKCWERAEKKEMDVQRMVAADFAKC